jgi:hypothetical protein
LEGTKRKLQKSKVEKKKLTKSRNNIPYKPPNKKTGGRTILVCDTNGPARVCVCVYNGLGDISTKNLERPVENASQDCESSTDRAGS